MIFFKINGLTINFRYFCIFNDSKISGFDKFSGLKAKALISAIYEKLIILLLLTILNCDCDCDCDCGCDCDYDYDYDYDQVYERELPIP